MEIYFRKTLKGHTKRQRQELVFPCAGAVLDHPGKSLYSGKADYHLCSCQSTLNLAVGKEENKKLGWQPCLKVSTTNFLKWTSKNIFYLKMVVLKLWSWLKSDIEVKSFKMNKMNKMNKTNKMNFDQRTVCGAPIRWWKYTTYNHCAIGFLS